MSGKQKVILFASIGVVIISLIIYGLDYVLKMENNAGSIADSLITVNFYPNSAEIYFNGNEPLNNGSVIDVGTAENGVKITAIDSSSTARDIYITAGSVEREIVIDLSPPFFSLNDERLRLCEQLLVIDENIIIITRTGFIFFVENWQNGNKARITSLALPNNAGKLFTEATRYDEQRLYLLRQQSLTVINYKHKIISGRQQLSPIHGFSFPTLSLFNDGGLVTSGRFIFNFDRQNGKLLERFSSESLLPLAPPFTGSVFLLFNDSAMLQSMDSAGNIIENLHLRIDGLAYPLVGDNGYYASLTNGGYLIVIQPESSTNRLWSKKIGKIEPTITPAPHVTGSAVYQFNNRTNSFFGFGLTGIQLFEPIASVIVNPIYHKDTIFLFKSSGVMESINTHNGKTKVFMPFVNRSSHYAADKVYFISLSETGQLAAYKRAD